MEFPKMYERLRELASRRGDRRLTLRIDRFEIEIRGLDAALESRLSRRWEGFVSPEPSGAPTCAIELFDAGPERWLAPAERGDPYPLEARLVPELVVAAENFGLGIGDGTEVRLGMTHQEREPDERVVENVVRYMVGRLSIEAGGFSLHAAGVVHEGKAYVLAGPSNAGKTTAVALCRGATSLGDDFSILLPDGDGWVVTPVPFDNTERVGTRPTRGRFPLAGVWRLRKADRPGVRASSGLVASSRLMNCVVAPWAMPDRVDRLLVTVGTCAAAGLYAELDFALDTPILSEIAIR